MFHLSWLGTYVRTTHDDHDDVVGRGAIDIVHDQHLAITEARLGADVGLRRGFGASVVLPVRLVSTTIDYYDTDGMAVELSNPGIHHRNETVSGLGDPMLLGTYARVIGDWRVGGRAGLSLPLGRTEENPFVLGPEGLAHQHIQMGTGTVNPILAVEVARPWGPWRVSAFAFTQQVAYANGKGYQAGDRYAGGLGTTRGVGKRWTLRGGLEVQAESAERWDDTVHLDDGNQGRIDAMLAAGASWKAGRTLTVDLGVKVPVYTHVVGGQLDMPAIIELGASWSFGGEPPVAEPDHDHAHDHDHDHDHEAEGHEHEDDTPVVHVDTTGLDVADVPEAAEGVQLVPVPGKVTIFDVWADWCKPCAVLEPMLVELVRANPDKVALRRIDVSDSDEWTIQLPHVRVYDAAGAKVLEVSSDGDLDAMVAKVRAAIEPAPVVVVEEPAPTVEEPPPVTEKAKPKKKPAKKKPAAPKRIKIKVTEAGFEPGSVTVPVGKPVTLVFERQTNKTCATEVVMKVDGKRIEKELPLGQIVELTITFPTKGTITYACAMDMIRGTITVK